MQDVKSLYEHEEKFFILCHCFGSLVGLKLAAVLEAEGKVGKLFLIDGSPEHLLKQMQFYLPTDCSDEELQRIIATGYAQKYINDNAVIAEIARQKSLDLQVAKIVEVGIKKTGVSPELVKSFMNSVAKRIKISLSQTKFAKCRQSVIILVKARTQMSVDISPDYGLQQYSTVDIVIHTLDGIHTSIIENPDLVDLIKLETSSMYSLKAHEVNVYQINLLANAAMEKTI